ncbi:transcriptional regulator, IclR family [Palleronia marisminoris]|uniref:IclR family transcriptional regulator n=1 Tax=Palleronia marisminoris TaxID=315423 RepID=UPI0008E796DC|nr:IclR family transcriptional regulator [Palleronia marisminoris]SFH27399.1 transcriptional regulator, IclR family [Palleronia marisminoris]
MTAGSGDRTLAILELFTEERLEWSPEELMAELGYTRPTLYRYLKTLKQAGFLVALPGRGLTLGPRVVELDFLMRRSDPLLSHGRAQLEALAARHPGSALLVRWYGSKLLCVDSVVSVPNPVSSYARGRPMPLGRGAISRAILAWLPRTRQGRLIEENLTQHAETTHGESVAEVQENLRRVRRDGVAIAFGEVTPGVIGTAAPVFDAGRSPIAVICFTASEADIGRDRLSPVADDVRRAARALCTALAENRLDPSRPAEGGAVYADQGVYK